MVGAFVRLALLIWLAVFATAAAAAEMSNVTWYSIAAQNGAMIGNASHQSMADGAGRLTIDTQDIDVGDEVPDGRSAFNEMRVRSMHMSWRTVRKEDAAGRTLTISVRSTTGRDWVRSDARIEDGTAAIIRQTPSETRTVAVPLPADTRFDGGEELLRGWNPAVQPRLEFESFNIDAMAVERVVIEAAPGLPGDPANSVAALRRTYQGDTLLSAVRLLLDRDGRIAEVVQPMFGTEVAIRMTDRKTATAPHPAYRVMARVMTKSPFRIPPSAVRGHIRYRFGFRDGIVFALPQTSEQRVVADGNFAVADICADCGPGLSNDAATLADALKPTMWMQSDHPRLRAIADPIAKLDISGAEKMKLLLAAARPYLRNIDFAGHYSALETLERRSGDCTEAAVLLAALGRAAGIPTQVASGMVYSRESYHGVSNVFLPHSWTLAYVDGAWRSFDLALDTFDSTHIALSIGDGDERSVRAAGQLAGLLRWDGMTEVRPPPVR